MKLVGLTLSLLLAACGTSGDDAYNDAGKDGGSGLDATADVPSQGDGSTGQDAAGCGTCPSGYTCGTANGIPVCRNTQTRIPLLSNVYVILMENTSLSTLQSAITAGTAPTIKNLQTNYASSSDYHGVAHPS